MNILEWQVIIFSYKVSSSSFTESAEIKVLLAIQSLKLKVEVIPVTR